MGIHICIYDNNGNELPQTKWDYIRQGNDRDFPNLIDYKKIKKGNEENNTEDYFQPLNIQEIRDKLKKLNWESQERYIQLLNFIEYGNCWIWFCY